MLEFTRIIEKRLKVSLMDLINRYMLKKRWGGKVVPLNKNIASEVIFLPTQEIMEILKRSKVTGIANCYCRETQRRNNKPNCNHTLRTCIHIGSGKSLYDIPRKSVNLRKISRKEVINLLEQCDNECLIHQLIYYPNPNFYYVICNCSPCCYVVLSKFLKIGFPQMIRSDFIAETDTNLCINCGKCEEWCYFRARSFSNNQLEFDATYCFGCGICISKCLQKAISLKLISSS